MYEGKPDLTERMSNTNVVVGMAVDVMPSASSINAITQGVIKEVGPSTFGDENKLRVKKKC